MNRRPFAFAAGVLFVLALAGCVNPPPPSPPDVPARPADVSPENSNTARLAAVRAYTVRIRNLVCGNIDVGTGWAVNRRTIVTNRHVVAGSHRIEVETFDGKPLAVASVEQAVGPDLALIHLAQDAPAVAPGLAAGNPKIETPVHLIGYPGGLTARQYSGVVLQYVSKDYLDPSGPVMEMSGNAFPGNSGSPVVNNADRVVGVTYAYQPSSGYIIAEPLSRLRPVLHGSGLTPVVPC
jgi:S1-C subfamily serine protease